MNDSLKKGFILLAILLAGASVLWGIYLSIFMFTKAGRQIQFVDDPAGTYYTVLPDSHGGYYIVPDFSKVNK